MARRSQAISRYVIHEFFGAAEKMRSAFEAGIGPDREVNSRRRFVWDYWFVAGQYNYLRTFARDFFEPAVYRRFLAGLRMWGAANLGCSSVSEPWLSYYINGCKQEFHVDALQGPWAFVFSLTRWDVRRFSGGETILLGQKVLDYWRDFESRRPLEGDVLIERIPARFNQLTVFDARVPHGVAAVEGTNDPFDSRVVLHGWFLAPTVVADGALTYGEVEPLVTESLSDWQLNRTHLGKLTGVLTTRLRIDAAGSVESVEVLASTLVGTSGATDAAAQATTLAVELARSLRFPRSRGATTLTLPFAAPDS
jgi:hypothetical protein